MRTLAATLVVVGLVVAAFAQDRPKPRTPTAAEKRALAKERKEKLKERKERAKTNAKQHEELAEKVRAALEPWDKKGLSGCVLVAKDGEVIFKQGYGYADREAKRKNTPDTIYDSCAITMVFTAVAALKLEMEGKLSLQDRLDKHLKYATGDIGSCTIEQLLTHASGVGDDFRNDATDINSRDAVIKDQLAAPLIHKPGEGFTYSTANYQIVAAVIEAVAGNYDRYVKRSVLDPAGMKNSDTDTGKLSSKHGAKRYGDDEKPRDVVGSDNNWTMRGRERIASTVEDVWRFNEALDWTDLLDTKAKETLFKHVSKYESMAFRIASHEVLGTGYFVNGDGWGARAYYARYPERDLMFVVMLNESLNSRAVELDVARDIERALSQRD